MSLDWDGTERMLLAVEADDDALVGMKLLDGYTSFIDATEGGKVCIYARSAV